MEVLAARSGLFSICLPWPQCAKQIRKKRNADVQSTDIDDDTSRNRNLCRPLKLATAVRPFTAVSSQDNPAIQVGELKAVRISRHLFNKILNEEISLREGSNVKKLSKAEAIVRGVVIGALKGDIRNVAILFRLAEQVGQFQEDDTKADITRIERVIVSWKPPGAETEEDE